MSAPSRYPPADSIPAPPVPALTDEHLSFLQRFGFDELLFEHWRKGLREGWLSQAKNCIEGELHPPEPGDIVPLPKRGSPDAMAANVAGEDAIRQGELGVVVLNGGMATRFGGVVKGIVEALPGRSFLALRAADVARAQTACEGRIHLFLMNSFATDEATRAHFAAHDNFGLPADQVHHFTQFAAPRLLPTGEVYLDDKGAISAYGTGHGDFAPAMRHSGALAQFLAAGGKTLFVSNVDNLGARISPLMVGCHALANAGAGVEATVEVAPKWPGDVGGSPYVHEGKLQLVEQIRYPEGFDPDIVDVFNTNTFHFDARALDRDFALGWYYVEKKVDGKRVVQVERLIGELSRFLKAQFVKVKRSGPENRFLPVKTPEDLVAAREEIAELYR